MNQSIKQNFDYKGSFVSSPQKTGTTAFLLTSALSFLYTLILLADKYQNISISKLLYKIFYKVEPSKFTNIITNISTIVLIYCIIQYKYFKDKMIQTSNLVISCIIIFCILFIGYVIYIIAPFSLWEKPIKINCRCTRPGIWFACKPNTNRESEKCKKLIKSTKKVNNSIYNFSQSLKNTIMGIPKSIQCIHIPEDSLKIGKIPNIDIPDKLIDPDSINLPRGNWGNCPVSLSDFSPF